MLTAVTCQRYNGEQSPSQLYPSLPNTYGMTRFARVPLWVKG